MGRGADGGRARCTRWTWRWKPPTGRGCCATCCEVFAKEKLNVIGVQTQTVKGMAWMTLTVEIADSGRLGKVLHLVAEVPGVRWAKRR